MKIVEKERLKSIMLTYLNDEDSHFEPVMFELFRMESEYFLHNRALSPRFKRNHLSQNLWTQVFEDLASVLSPLQMEQIFERISADFQETCNLFNKLVQTQNLLQPDTGGQD